MSTIINPIRVGRVLPYIEEMKKSDVFEEFFVEAVARKVTDAGLSHSEFGRRVFGTDSGSRLWRAAREKDRKRSISVGEAYLMAEALGRDLPGLLWEIVQEAKASDILT